MIQYQTLYTTWPALVEIMTNSKYKNFSDAVFDYFEIILDLSKGDYESLAHDPYFQTIWNRYYAANRVIDNHKSFFDDFEDQLSDGLCRDIIILNKEADYCDEIRNKKGVLVLSEKNLDILNHLFLSNEINLLPQQSFKGEKEIGSLDGWEAFWIKQDRCAPCHFTTNAAVIFDKFIFEDSIENGVRNVVSLVKTLIHPKYEDAFDLTIVTKKSNIFNHETLSKWLEVLIVKLQEETGKDFNLEFILHEGPNLHDRYLNTNHFTIKVGTNFQAFDKKHFDLVKERQKVEIKGNLAFIKHQHSHGFLHDLNENFHFVMPNVKGNCKYDPKVDKKVPDRCFSYSKKQNRLFYKYS